MTLLPCKYYCGIDLYARKMYVCVLNQQGNVQVHKNIDTDPALFLDLISPYQDGSFVSFFTFFRSIGDFYFLTTGGHIDVGPNRLSVQYPVNSTDDTITHLFRHAATTPFRSQYFPNTVCTFYDPITNESGPFMVVRCQHSVF